MHHIKGKQQTRMGSHDLFGDWKTMFTGEGSVQEIQEGVK